MRVTFCASGGLRPLTDRFVVPKAQASCGTPSPLIVKGDDDGCCKAHRGGKKLEVMHVDNIWLKLRFGIRHEAIDGGVGLAIGQGSGSDVVYDSRHIAIAHALVLGSSGCTGGGCDHHPVASLLERRCQGCSVAFCAGGFPRRKAVCDQEYGQWLRHG
jgi:hypothetical protein